MYWDIKMADTYTLYSPLKRDEDNFISALNFIDLSANNIIDASKIAFTESIKIALSNCNEAHFWKVIQHALRMFSFKIKINNQFNFKNIPATSIPSINPPRTCGIL